MIEQDLDSCMNVAEYLSLVLLILMSFITYHAKDRYFKVSKSAFQKVLAGLCMLLIVPLVRALKANRWLDGAPVLGQESSQDLLEAVLLLGGGLLITIGLIQRLRWSHSKQVFRWTSGTAKQFRLSSPIRQEERNPVNGQQEAVPKDLLQTVTKDLQMKLVEAEQISEVIQVIDHSLRPHLEFDILRLAVFDARGLNITQYCLGPTGNLLTERNRSISTGKTQLGLLFAAPQILRCFDLPRSVFSDDRWLSSCGAKSATTYPLVLNGITLAALTFAFVDRKAATDLQDYVVAGLAPSLIALVKCDTTSQQLLSYNRQVLDLIGALKRMASPEEKSSNLHQLVQIIAKKLPSTVCRLWKYSENDDCLELAAHAEIRERSNLRNLNVRFPLLHAYWHRLALSVGRVIMVQQREERMRMDDREMELSLLCDVQSAILVPLLSGKKSLGILAVGEQRSWERRSFSLPETIFVRAIGSIATQELLSILQGDISRSLTRKVERLEQQSLLSDLFAELPQHLITPITSILARSEQLLKSAAEKDPAITKHLTIINRQAEKIAREIRKIQEVRQQQVCT